jgi:hypothetical protein
MQCLESRWMSSGSLTVQPGEKPIRREYLGGVGVDTGDGGVAVIGVVAAGGRVTGRGTLDVFSIELDGTRDDGGENDDRVGRL